MENETRQDLGYENTQGNTRKYHLQKELKMQRGQENSQPEPSQVCRIRFKNGDVKKLAWEFAEMYVKRGAEIIEWV